MPSPLSLRGQARASASRAFTLIELLTVVAIVGILVGILIPVVGTMRRSAADAACASNVRQLTGAYLLFMRDNKMQPLPAAVHPGDSMSEGHNLNGFFLLRYYYKPGPRYNWTTDNKPIYENIEHCPSVKMNGLSQNPTMDAAFTIDYGVRQTGSFNFAQFSQPARSPILWDSFVSAWKPNNGAMEKSMPLRHKGGTAINCGFLDGHVECIAIPDKRLYSQWWDQATKGPDVSNTKLGQGASLGVTAVPSS